MSVQFTRCTFCIVSAVLLVVAGSYQNASGQESSLKRDQKVRVFGKGALSYGQTGYVAGFKNGMLYLTNGGDFRIDRAITNAGDTVGFPYAGARYIPGTDTLTGMTDNGDTVSFPLADIARIDAQYYTKSTRRNVTFDRNTLRSRLRYGTKYPDLQVVPIDSILQIKVWHNSSALAPMLGVLIGGAAGYGMAVATKSDDDLAEWVNEAVYGRDYRIVLGVATGAVLGGMVGAVIGRGHWQELKVNELHMSLVPEYRNGPGLSLAVKF